MPVWTCNEDYPPKRNTTWKNVSFLYLFTHLCDREPHVHRGDNGFVIPYFTLPLTDREKDNIYCWGGQYRELDALWIASDELEIPAYKILAEPDSQLSFNGLECCETIEKATDIPTYYYLMRYFGRDAEDEKKRRCPCCGKSWHVKQPDNSPFWKFDFQCHKCRLVSSFGVDLNLRYAKIGEPHKPGKQSKKQ